MSYSRYLTVFLLLGTLLVGVLPINAQDTSSNPLITAENISELSEIARLGRGRVTDVAWSPDGQLLAIGGGAGVWLYSSDYEEMGLMEVPVQDVRWITDSQFLTANFRTLTVWDVETHDILTTIEIEGSAPRDLAISPDGTQIAVAGGRTVRLLDLETLEVVQQLEGHSGSVNGVVWLSQLELLSADSHGNVVRWNAVEGTSIGSQELTTGIETIRLSPTSSMLAIGFTNGELRVVDMASDSILHSGEPSADLVVELAWSPDGSQLATARSSGRIQIWNGATGQSAPDIEVFPEGGRAFQFDIAWTTGSDRLVVATEVEVALFDAETGFYVRLIDQFSIDSFEVNWSPNSSYLEATWAAPPPNDNIAVWEVASGEMVALVEHAGLGMWVADSQSFVYLDQTARPLSFRVWSMEGDGVPWLPDLSGIERVMVSPDGTLLAALVGEDVIDIHGLSADFSSTIEPDGRIFTVAWSPHSTYFLTVGGGIVQVWDATTGEIVHGLATMANMDFAFSPDETLLAISTGEDGFELWDLQTGQLLNTVQTPYQFRFLDWSPNGDLLLISHVGGMSFWSTETWEEVFAIESNGRGSWSPDGTMIATPGSDGIIRIWGIPDS